MGYDPFAGGVSDLSYVRLLISDVTPGSEVFTDQELTVFLTREGGPLRAAAQALDTIASNEALTSKFIRTQDLHTDGAKVAAELRARAGQLRRQAADADGDGMHALHVVNPGTRGSRVELVEEPVRDWWVL